MFALLMGLLIISLPANAQKRKNKKKGKKEKVKTATDDNKNNVKLQAQLFEGLTAKIKGNIEGAIAAFKACLTIDPQNDAAMYELAKIYFEQPDKQQALAYAKTAAAIDAKNKWYQFLYAEVLAMNLDFDEAAKVYEKLIDQNADDYEYYFDLAYMYIQAGKFENAIKTYDKLEGKIGVVEDICIQKQKLYIQLGELERAAGEIRKLVKMYPEEVRYYLLLIELYEANGKDEKAQEVTAELKKVAPNNPYVNLRMADIYDTRGELQKADEERTKAFKHPELPLEIKARRIARYTENFNLAGTLMENKKKVLDLAAVMVKTHEKESMSHLMHGDLLYKLEEKPDALAAYQKAISLKKNQYDVWANIMHLNLELTDYEELIKSCDEAMSFFPNQAEPYYYKGLAYSQQNKHEKAIKPLKRGAMISGDNDLLAAQIHSQLGNSYNSIKQYENSDKSFEKCLKLTPNNATVMNNYSYYLSLRGDNLERAEELAKKANMIEPANAAYQDTYAWVLYVRNKFEDAKIWIEKSLSNGGDQSGVIVEHHGDVLFQLNQVDQAVKAWENAKLLGGGSAQLDQKIKNRSLPK